MAGYAIVLASGKLERLFAVANVASIAGASDVPVDVFLTMDGLEAFDEEVIENESWESGVVAEAMMTSEDTDVPMFYESMGQAKEIGPVSMYACELSMDILDKSLEDYHEMIDDVLGVSGFLSMAEDKQIIFV
ncbi:MAG: DsrE/DsrF/DrsH-like family protein [Halobacteriales archaeon]